MNILELKAKCNRRVWLAASLAVFLLLAQWRYFPFPETAGLSLLDWFKKLPERNQGGFEETVQWIVVGMIMAVVPGLLSVISGWVIAAFISLAVVVKRELLPRKGERREAAGHTAAGRMIPRLLLLVFLLAVIGGEVAQFASQRSRQRLKPPDGFPGTEQLTMMDSRTLEQFTKPMNQWWKKDRDGYYRNPKTGEYTLRPETVCASCGQPIPIQPMAREGKCPKCGKWPLRDPFPEPKGKGGVEPAGRGEMGKGGPS